MQSGIFLVRYRTKILDAGMPMLELVLSMPMTSYAAGVTSSSLAIGQTIRVLFGF